MYLKISLLTFFSVTLKTCITSSLKSSNVSCETLQLSFGEVSSKFSVCAVKNARPVNLCGKCAKAYQAVLNVHSDFVNISSAGEKCSENFFKSDSLSIVNVIFSNVLNLWSTANCDSCYVNTEGKIDYSNFSPIIGNFFSNLTELSHCFNSSINLLGNAGNDTCKDCRSIYSRLDSLYKDIVEGSPLDNPLDKICMDVVDAMNITRHQWNDVYHCKEFSTDIGYSNIILTVLIAILPVTFYVVARFISVIEKIQLVQPKRRFFSQSNSYTTQ